ncbi:hypothetical protein AVEN_69757-1 [Araneus ventricosus]|uniref:Uncharacterized protein n=1 Tax=Araneus ventricosus TaxID=182803 RepID=A0A4Y2CVY2_ARAVE|nr:hypothetical protein AVEN_69757-1 [Araneus ventricosus]
MFPSLHSSLAEAPIQSMTSAGEEGQEQGNKSFPLSTNYWFMTMGEMQLQFQSRYHMGRSLILPLCLLVLAGKNGVKWIVAIVKKLPRDFDESTLFRHP